MATINWPATKAPTVRGRDIEYFPAVKAPTVRGHEVATFPPTKVPIATIPFPVPTTTLFNQIDRPREPTSWKRVEDLPFYAAFSEAQAATTDRGNPTLYKWGAVEFQIWPLNIHELDHETATDWAHKEIVSAALYREWVGENDEKIHMRGLLFPYRIGGVSDIERLNSMRRAGMANLLMRGHGEYMGWFVIERLQRSHTFLSSEGMGRQISFEVEFARVPVPDPDKYFSNLWMTTGAAGL